MVEVLNLTNPTANDFKVPQIKTEGFTYTWPFRDLLYFSSKIMLTCQNAILVYFQIVRKGILGPDSKYM